MLRFPWLLAIFAAYLLLAIFLVPPLPHIHTRYITVAWEMWQRNDFLLPVLNGQPYPHKPPLFFWLIHLGWALFGVNDLWTRLVAPAFFLGCVALAPALGALLWPQRQPVRWLSAVVLIGTLIFPVYAVFPMMEGLMGLFCLLAWIGTAQAWRGRPLRGWLLAGIAIGCGILSKGPVMLLYTLPPILFAPLWMDEDRPHWGKWALGGFVAVVIGALIGLAWAIPAALAGGGQYSRDIFFNQTVNRFSGELGHPEPWWWFFAMLPWALFPWIYWPPFWRGLLRRDMADAGVKFCAITAAITVAVFSSVASKHVHYLVPLLPLFALVTARALAGIAPLQQERRLALPVILGLVAALAALVYSLAVHAPDAPWAAPLQGVIASQPAYMQHISLALGLASLLVLALVLLMPKGGLGFAVQRLALMALGLTLVMAVEVKISFYRYLDVTPMAMEIAQYDREGRPIAINEEYFGQFHYTARITRPFAVITDRPAQLAWAAAHPDGVFLSFIRSGQESLPAQPLYLTPYKKKFLAAWSARTVTATQGQVLNARF